MSLSASPRRSESTTPKKREPQAPRYVVTVRAAGSSQTQIWDTREPLPVGRPFRWVLERAANGSIRIRELGPRSSTKASPVLARPIPAAELLTRFSIDLQSDFGLTIQPVRELGPAYADAATESTGELRAYACLGNWILSAQPVGEAYTGRAHGARVFELKRSGSAGKDARYTVAFSLEGVALPGGKKEFSAQELAAEPIRFGELTWRFDLRAGAELTASSRDQLAAAEVAWFRRAIVASSLGILALIGASALLPKPQKEELIPEQFAKIVIPPKPMAAAPAAPQGSDAPAASADPTPKSVQKAEVVQAFRAKQLQNAMSGLLKGGMTSLLAQSDFVAGNAHSANARKTLSGKSSAMQATASDTGVSNSRDVKVAAIGGEGGGGAGGGVGYGKGTRAGVSGQGKSLVSMDTPGSSVDEGLTKEEVGEVIHRHLSEVRYCYESAMLRTPDIEGKLMVAFVIGGSGSVRSADVQQSTLPDPRLDDCIIRRLMTWKFPNPRGGVDVKVSYPFLFKTLGR